MFEYAVEISGVSKMYRMFKTKRRQIMALLGFPTSSQSYDEFWALRDVNLTVAPGERLGIIGPNGAGKSTLLKIIAGQVRPTEGKVAVRGRIQALMELGTGFHPEFSGRENIFAALSYQGVTGRSARERFNEVVEFSELEDFIDKPLKTYSAGMYARLAFSVATTIEPEILIIDEVLGAGDAYFAGKCRDRMNCLTQDSGATVLFVSHDASSVQQLCTRVIWIKKGGIVMDGPANQVVKAYVDAMRFETELRHRAREMRLSKGQARTLMGDDDIYRKLLFRLRAATHHPVQKHYVADIRLFHHNNVMAHIDVGGARDNDERDCSHLISDRRTTDWSEPVQLTGGLARCYEDRGSEDGHAPFVLCIPAYLASRLSEFSISIAGKFNATEMLYLEQWTGEEYRRVGTIIEESYVKFPLAETVVDKVGREAQYPKNSVGENISEPEKEISGSDLRDEEFSAYRLLAIEHVEFIGHDGKSARVFPLGSNVSVDIHFEAKREIVNPVFAITFHRIDGLQMDHQNTQLLNQKLGAIHDRGVARFSFRPLRLGPGDYAVTAAILKYLDLDAWTDQPPSYDRHDRQYFLTIYSTAPSGRNLGAVLQESEFRLLRGAEPIDATIDEAQIQ